MNSRILAKFGRFFYFGFISYVILLGFIFIDSLIGLRKYTVLFQNFGYIPISDQTLTSTKMNLFRSQRNFYLSSFSIFLILLAQIIKKYIVLQVSSKASLMQAKHVSEQYLNLLTDNESSQSEKSNKKPDSSKTIDELKD
ncbi:hypothetical protein MXB_1013, partial [Myxobolus squamalis]